MDWVPPVLIACCKDSRDPDIFSPVIVPIVAVCEIARGFQFEPSPALVCAIKQREFFLGFPRKLRLLAGIQPKLIPMGKVAIVAEFVPLVFPADLVEFGLIPVFFEFGEFEGGVQAVGIVQKVVGSLYSAAIAVHAFEPVCAHWRDVQRCLEDHDGESEVTEEHG